VAGLSPPDGSRDARIEDPTNLWIIHPAGRALLPLALRAGVGANAVSVAGFVLGAGGAVAFHFWRDWRMAALGLGLCIAWMIADGLDGMIARATGTASDLGRFLDGVCDHAVFACLYVSLAASVGTAGAWLLAACAGAVHGVQAAVYEGERARYHRRIKRAPWSPSRRRSRNLLVGAYDAVACGLDRWCELFDRELAAGGPGLAQAYGRAAAGPMRLMAMLSNNMRIAAVFLACLAGDPRLFWWWELGPMTAVVVAGVAWHRRVERRAMKCGQAGAG
jgi:phosphatidylglycerophosphate synthase